MRKFSTAVNRFIALLLVFILGFLSCVGAIVGVGYIAYSKVSIDFLEDLFYNFFARHSFVFATVVGFGCCSNKVAIYFIGSIVFDYIYINIINLTNSKSCIIFASETER